MRLLEFVLNLLGWILFFYVGVNLFSSVSLYKVAINVSLFILSCNLLYWGLKLHNKRNKR